MEFKKVYNEMRTDRGIEYEKDEAELRENFVRVEVYHTPDIYEMAPSLIKVTHGFKQTDDWTTRWIFTSPNRELAIREAIRILDSYELGQKRVDMTDWNDLEKGGKV